MRFLFLIGAVVLSNAATIPVHPDEVEPANMDTILRAVGAPPCMRQCIDPLMRNLSSIWDMHNLSNDTQKICKSHDDAISCLQKNQFCDLQGAFAKAASPIRHRCDTQAALFNEVEHCLTPNIDSVMQECDAKCNARSRLTEFTNNEVVKSAAKMGGNVFTVMEHIGDLCESLSCLLPCLTTSMNNVCKLSGWVTLDALMQPLEAVSFMVNGMNPVIKDVVFKKMDRRCHFVLDSNIQKKVRKGDFGSLNIVSFYNLF